MRDLDRFDRMLLGTHPASPTRATYRAAPVYASPEHEPAVITSKRPPRFVAYMACPMCGFERVGIEYQGELRNGSKVHTLAAHAPQMGRCDNGKPRCLGVGMRLVLVDGIWQGAPRP